MQSSVAGFHFEGVVPTRQTGALGGKGTLSLWWKAYLETSGPQRAMPTLKGELEINLLLCYLTPLPQTRALQK